MKHARFTTMAAGLLLAATTGGALAFGHGGPGGGPGMGGHGGPGGLPLPLPILVSEMTPTQRGQLRDIMQADRPVMKGLMQQLRAAHDALSDRVLSPGALGASDLDAQVKQIAALRDQLVQQALATTLKVRALLTPEQLADAKSKVARLRELHAEMRGLFGAPADAPDDDGSPD